MLKKRNLLFLSLLILGVLLLSSCFLKPPVMVTFDSQGGSAVDSQMVNYGEKATNPTAPTKTGYTFGGWYKEPGCTNRWDFDSATVTSDVTLYAKWTTNIFTVTYNGNNNKAGTVPVDPASPYESGATVTVLGNTGDLARINDMGTSYRFTGWNTKADGSGTDQAEGSTFTMGAFPVTLYAQWTPYVLRDTGPAGGYIFYDKGSYFGIFGSPSWRYLEAAPVSTEWTSIQWGSYGNWIGGTETGIGTGQNNTTKIVTWLNSHSETGCAAQLCNDLIVDGYSDWFLPSKDELDLMYLNLKVSGVGGFADYFYWSSSEDGAYYAWPQNFGWVFTFTYNKHTTLWVRAARAF